jgi:hypothetical protein
MTTQKRARGVGDGHLVAGAGVGRSRRQIARVPGGQPDRSRPVSSPTQAPGRWWPCRSRAGSQPSGGAARIAARTAASIGNPIQNHRPAGAAPRRRRGSRRRCRPAPGSVVPAPSSAGQAAPSRAPRHGRRRCWTRRCRAASSHRAPPRSRRRRPGSSTAGATRTRAGRSAPRPGCRSGRPPGSHRCRDQRAGWAAPNAHAVSRARPSADHHPATPARVGRELLGDHPPHGRG